MKCLRVAHVASFHGNIGDNANHMGFRPWFEGIVGCSVSWTNIEIREFYWKDKYWNKDFVSLVNAHDLLIVGGGNYFELWVDNSPTGTSIAIEIDLFKDIRVPVLFNALGVDPGQGVSGKSLERFRQFLDLLLSSQQYLVSVRNDGAIENLEKHLGIEYAEKVSVIPDSGFFFPKPIIPANNSDKLRVGINLACDMPAVRFSGFSDYGGVHAFVKEIAETITALFKSLPVVEFVMFPHIFRDLEIISAVIENLDDRVRRTILTVAAYGTGDEAAKSTFSAYAGCDLVLAMRFHANVCPIGMNVPTLGLSCYPQIANLYNDLGFPELAIDVSRPNFRRNLVLASSRILSRDTNIQLMLNNVNAKVRTLRSEFEPKLKSWIDKYI